jgi:CheY-like chemotaxis protein
MNSFCQFPTRSPRLLIIDDNAVLRDILVGGLRKLGLDTLPAASGREAVGLLGHDPAAFGLALVDLCMPEMDGLATAAALTRLSPSLCCCLMAGGLPPDDETLRSAGVVKVFLKPFGLEVLAGELRRLLSYQSTIISPTAS